VTKGWKDTKAKKLIKERKKETRDMIGPQNKTDEKDNRRKGRI
jgi:hypothetical protein